MIFRYLIENEQIPNQWKEANLKAIYKKGAKDTAENYRPISLTCVPCKIMETIITDKVVDHMIKK